jgi:hypothetical protein
MQSMSHAWHFENEKTLLFPCEQCSSFGVEEGVKDSWICKGCQES